MTLDESVATPMYNFRTFDEYRPVGDSAFADSEQPFEMPGRRSFLRVDGHAFHTYSVYARGLETIGGSYYLLERGPPYAVSSTSRSSSCTTR